MDTATVVVTILVAVLFTFSASIKLLGVSQSLAIRDHLGVKPLQWRLIGVCELAGVAGVLVGLMWAPIGIAAAICCRSVPSPFICVPPTAPRTWRRP